MENPKPQQFVGVEEHNKARKSIKSKISLALNKNQARGLKSQQRLLTKFQKKCQQVMNDSGGLDEAQPGHAEANKNEDVADNPQPHAKPQSEPPHEEDLLTT